MYDCFGIWIPIVHGYDIFFRSAINPRTFDILRLWNLSSLICPWYYHQTVSIYFKSTIISNVLNWIDQHCPLKTLFKLNITNISNRKMCPKQWQKYIILRCRYIWKPTIFMAYADIYFHPLSILHIQFSHSTSMLHIPFSVHFVFFNNRRVSKKYRVWPGCFWPDKHTLNVIVCVTCLKIWTLLSSVSR